MGWTLGGLQPHEQYPRLACLGEANFSDHGANRLGASALMQGLADGYFVIPYTLGNYLTTQFGKKWTPTTPHSNRL
jgi:succinate dehydrogenase / fumarate reductase flavoprotein subunit